MSEIKGVESIFELRNGVKIQVEQENEVDGKKVREFNQRAYVIDSTNYNGTLMAVESGRKFKIIEE
jgi:hypothetical protein